jgi:hypothetical protein
VVGIETGALNVARTASPELVDDAVVARGSVQREPREHVQRAHEAFGSRRSESAVKPWISRNRTVARGLARWTVVGRLDEIGDLRRDESREVRVAGAGDRSEERRLRAIA